METKVTLNKELLNKGTFNMYLTFKFTPTDSDRYKHFSVWEMDTRKNPPSYYLIPFMTATCKSSV